MDYSNYNNNREENLCSWPIILLCLYLFFPLGVYLIIKKQKLHRRNIFTIGNKTLSSSISLFIVGFLMYIPKIAILGYSEEDENYKELSSIIKSNMYKYIIIIANLLLIVGFLVLIIAILQKLKSRRYRKYISLVVNREIESLDEIASKISLSKKTVIKDLKKLIDNNYLEKYDISEEEGRIFNVQDEKIKKHLEEKKKEENTRIVKCPNCGANNLLEEKIGKCEFCNSYIE